MESTRVDKWLWAVRLYPTRTAATDGCHAGHVQVNDAAAKASTSVKIGDRVMVTGRGDLRVLEVIKVIEKRVGAALAAECFIDHSPPPAPREFAAPFLIRDRGSGRPTKKDRRQIDRWRR
jgi:ribosome-associated heat shock protein Hsp15